MIPALKRAARTLLQFIAGGGLTALTNVLVGGMAPETAVLVTTIYSTLLSFIQNALENAGAVPKLLR